MYQKATTGECDACNARLCRFKRGGDARPSHRMIYLSHGERIETGENACLKLWTVVSGTAATCTTLQDGRRQISGIERPGSTLCGPMASEDRPTWLEALEPAQICEQDFSAQLPELRDNAEFLFAIFGVIHKRLEIVTRHLTTLGRLDSTERVILFLAETAAAWEAPGPVHLPMSRDEIADYLGLNAETVSRIFSKLKKTGLFKFHGPTAFTVPNPAAIARRLPVAPATATTDPKAASTALRAILARECPA